MRPFSENLEARTPFSSWHVVTPDRSFSEALEPLLKTHPATMRIIVTDPSVRALHASRFPSGLPILEIGEGESTKTLATVESLVEKLLDLGMDRGGALLAIGGGLVCDVTAFVAATWMRGIGCGLIPTTLLAQADAGIGGKCGINFCNRKNLIGTIRPPDFCLCDPTFLKTLPRQDVASGLSEIAKMALLFDADLLGYLETHAPALLDADVNLTAHAIERSLELKKSIVDIDPYEQNERRKLNLGHTLGHAVESLLGLRHGEAVAIGMRLAARISVDRHLLSIHDRRRLDRLLDWLDLPRLSSIGSLSPNAISHALRADKKREGDLIHFVLLEGLGTSSCRIEAFPLTQLDAWLVDSWPSFIDCANG